MESSISLDLTSLRGAYHSKSLTPVDIVKIIYKRIAARGKDAVWIHLLPKAQVLEAATKLQLRFEKGEDLPLFGVPFAVKDNLDVAGLPTTAACPEFAYKATKSSPLVDRLLAAGALLIGKTNLDQFATGLVGTRSPYGVPRCVFNPEYISGGSSSGSAVAVAAGLVSFALGTDTAGSGRVPAAFNNIVGWKPTRGLLSTRGLVPACRTLDCVTVLSLTCDDALQIGQILQGYDAEDPWSRVSPGRLPPWPTPFRYGVPAPHQLSFFGDAEAQKLFKQALTSLEECGGRPTEIDFEPFAEAASLLYSGPWVAERLAAIESFWGEHPDALLKVTASIIRGATKWQATDVFKAIYQLEELKRRTAATWKKIDVMVLPTTGTIYTVAMVDKDPIQLNSNLGHYTNFANLLDLAAVAVPASFRPNGLPFGISLLAPAFRDEALCALGGRFHSTLGGSMGATGHPVISPGSGDLPWDVEKKDRETRYELAVVGAHLTGEPLNHQLTSRGGYLVKATRTATDYKLFALSGTTPPKPGLVHTPGFTGPGIDVEIWSLNDATFGAFVHEVPPPLAIGNARLASGSLVKCFVCEPSALEGAVDITPFGGWRAYRRQSTTANGAIGSRQV